LLTDVMWDGQLKVQAAGNGLHNYMDEFSFWPSGRVRSALNRLYGNLIDSQCPSALGIGVSWFVRGREVTTLKMQVNGCVPVCVGQGATEAVAGNASTTTVGYELAISQGGAPFTTFAAFSEAGWAGGTAHTDSLAIDITDAVFRLRITSGGITTAEMVRSGFIDIGTLADHLDTSLPAPSNGRGILSIHPMPFRTALVVRLDLPPGAPGTVSMLDLQGRLIETKSVIGEGVTLVEMGKTVSPPPGVYLIRFSRNGETFSQRAVRVR
jgi:hypothetical protein